MRVRTYGFPGCFTRPTRNPRLATPRRKSSTSKLVRPRTFRIAAKRPAQGRKNDADLVASRAFTRATRGLLDRVGGRAFHLDGLALYHLVRVWKGTYEWARGESIGLLERPRILRENAPWDRL